jgi:GEVED domain
MKNPKSKKLVLILLLIAISILAVKICKNSFFNKQFDYGDAPLIYKIAIHHKSDKGPYFGNKRGNYANNQEYISFADAREDSISNKDDAFFTRKEDVNSYSPLFAPEINAAEQVYNLKIPISAAELGDPVCAWIDFNGNEIFDQDEKSFSEYKGGGYVNLFWRLPLEITSGLTYIRMRTCSKLYEEEIKYPYGKATTGEVEDYVIRIRKINIPSAEKKEKLDLNILSGTSGLLNTVEAIKNLKFGNINFAITLDKTKPDIAGINEMHDASITGIRFGHNVENLITKEKPIAISFKASELLQNFNFQIIDIDAGDRIKVQGFKAGKPVRMEVSNLTDNFYYQFNSVTKEIFGDAYADAGGEDFIHSSLDMGVNIGFLGMIDSVRLTYTDDAEKTSGTFTLGNFSIRKYKYEEVFVKNLVAKEDKGVINLDWETEKSEHLASYKVERSMDGVSYEVINTALTVNTNNFHFCDKAVLPEKAILFYRIKLIQDDYHFSYSPTFRLTRNSSQSLLGFKPNTFSFKDDLQLILLKDMPGVIDISMYDYDAKKVKGWTFKDKNKNDSLSITQLSNLPHNIYYIKIFNNNIKYLVEVSNW